MAASVGHDVVVFDLDTNQRLKCLKGHDDNVYVLKFNSDASKVVSGSLNHSIIVWNWQDRESPSFILRGHKGMVRDLSLSHDGCLLFSASWDQTVKMWDITTAKLCRTFTYTVEVGSVTASPTSSIVAVGTRDGHLQCMDWVSGTCVFANDVAIEGITALKFRADGNILVCGSSSGELFSLNAMAWSTVAFVQMEGSIYHISFHPSGNNVVLGSSTGDVRNWNVFKEEFSSYSVHSMASVSGLAFRNRCDDTIVGTRDGLVRVWCGPSAKPNLNFFNTTRENELGDLALSADGTLAVSVRLRNWFSVWNTTTGALRASYSSQDVSRCIAISMDGKKIASTDANGSIRLWDSIQGPGESDPSWEANSEVFDLAFCSDGSKLMTYSAGQPVRIQIWNTALCKKRRRDTSVWKKPIRDFFHF